MAQTFNEFSVSIEKNLGINENLPPTSSSETRNVESIIAKFENHPSIVTIPNLFDKNSIFSFEETEKIEEKDIKNLDIKKELLSSDVPTKIIKEFDHLFVSFSTRNSSFHLYIRDLFMEYNAIEFTSYADDTSPDTYWQNFDEINKTLEIYMSKIC